MGFSCSIKFLYYVKLTKTRQHLWNISDAGVPIFQYMEFVFCGFLSRPANIQYGNWVIFSALTIKSSQCEENTLSWILAAFYVSSNLNGRLSVHAYELRKKLPWFSLTNFLLVQKWGLQSFFSKCICLQCCRKLGLTLPQELSSVRAHRNGFFGQSIQTLLV